MARFDTSGIDELIGEMQRLKIDEGPIADDMVNTAVEIIQSEWRKSIKKHGHYRTGELYKSIIIGGGPYRNWDGVSRNVYPEGEDRHGKKAGNGNSKKRKKRRSKRWKNGVISNADKAFLLNYGCRRFGGSYFIEEAEENSEEPVQKACKAIWDKFLASAGK